MINYMLTKLETQMRQAVALQRDGNLPVALVGYELILEALYFYEGLGYNQRLPYQHQLYEPV